MQKSFYDKMKSKKLTEFTVKNWTIDQEIANQLVASPTRWKN